MLLLTGCSGSGRHNASPVTTLLQTDDWTPPTVSGPPSAAAFCTVVTAMYRHEAELPVAAKQVKPRILEDFVATIPTAEKVAPPDIAGPARTYLGSLAPLLDALARAGLDYRKVPKGTLTPFLLDPGVRSAGDAVLGYSERVCHYTIGGGPTQP